MPDPVTKRVKDSLKRVKVRKKIVKDSTSRMAMVKLSSLICPCVL